MSLSPFSKYYCKLLIAIFCVFAINIGSAQSKTEGELVQKIVQSLQQKDSLMYANVFLSADSMARITLRKAPDTSDVFLRSKYLIESPEMILFQDSMIKTQASDLFKAVLVRGLKLGVHWNDIVTSRYELVVLPKTRDAALEAIAPERFVGYVFIEDMQTRKIYTMALSEMMKIDGKWYGGELNYIFEADTKDIFNKKMNAEKLRLRKGLPDTLGEYADTTIKDEEEPSTKRKQIADRKLFVGMLDQEIPISLYIRYIKGDCPAAICSWDAIIKIDNNEYLSVEVSKSADGKWSFMEHESGELLEVGIVGTKLEGIYSATVDKVDYDAELTERTMSKKRLEFLDALIERNSER